MHKRKTSAGQIAVGGVLAGLAVAVLSLGTLIPGMTYVCPMICALLLETVRLTCGRQIGWAWYGAVSILGLLLCQDWEASAMFLFLGYYPLVRPLLQNKKAVVLYKLLIFNISIAVEYFILLRILGIPDLTEDFAPMNLLMLLVMLILGNVTFSLLDMLLGKIQRKWKENV